MGTKLPRCFHYITPFCYPKVRMERTTLVPPIRRPAILAAKAEGGEHLLVYQTTTTNTELHAMLKKSGLPCRVYGLKRDLLEDEVDENLTFRPFSEERFIEDLRTARAVLSGGSFTLMSEAIYLHKPMLSVPVQGQFEQVINAFYLQKLGYGCFAPEVTTAKLGEFLERLPDFAQALASYRQDGNGQAFAVLKEQLRRAAEHKRR